MPEKDPKNFDKLKPEPRPKPGPTQKPSPTYNSDANAVLGRASTIV